MTPSASIQEDVARTGIAGLDELLRGGLPKGHIFLIEGMPGSGKTTLALQFILEGVAVGERTLYVTLSESWRDLQLAARSHGWSLDGVECLELLLASDLGSEPESIMYHPSEIELSETLRRIRDAVQQSKPSRVVVDSLTEIRLQSQGPLRYRREVLSIREYLRSCGCTALLLDELREEMTAQSVVHGIIEMHRQTPEFGQSRRRIQVAKMRGVGFCEGFHDYVIERGGLKVFPRIINADHRTESIGEIVSSDLPRLDLLLGGGLPAGSTTLLVGPAGSGKSSIASQYVIGSLRKNRDAAIFTFDETVASYLTRGAGLGIDLRPFVEKGLLRLRQIDPGEVLPGQFAQMVRTAVEEQHVRILVIDSLSGYINAMPDERSVLVQLHELVTYLNHKGVLTLLVLSQAGLFDSPENPIDTSYLTDNVLLFRLFEAAGEVRRAISMVKKRTGPHEFTIRELKISSAGLGIGEPLTQFQGVLTGVPRFTGSDATLMRSGDREL